MIFGSLFGGGGGGTEIKETTNRTRLPDFQEPAARKVIDLAHGGLKKPLSFFPDQTFADFNQLQGQGQQGRVDLAGRLGSTINNAETQFNSLLSPQSVVGDPSIQAAIDFGIGRLGEQFTESILPTIRDNSLAAGGLGDARHDIAADQAFRGFSRAGAELIPQIMLPEQARREQLSLQALQSMPTLTNQMLAPSTLLGDVGNEQQAMEQQRINEELARFEFEQREPHERLSMFAPFALSPVGQDSTSQQLVPQQGGGGLGGLLKAGLGIAGMASGFPGLSMFGNSAIGGTTLPMMSSIFNMSDIT
jgi:hypothetical protein